MRGRARIDCRPAEGLHFTTALMADVRAKGRRGAPTTLHVGYGTFKPVRVEQVEDHQVDLGACLVSVDGLGADPREA